MNPEPTDEGSWKDVAIAVAVPVALTIVGLIAAAALIFCLGWLTNHVVDLFQSGYAEAGA